MEIKDFDIEKLRKKFNNLKDVILRLGVYKNYRVLETGSGNFIYSVIGNTQGWYSVVCFYNNLNNLEIYDMHVFKRYQERYLKRRCYDNFELINSFLERNSDGIVYLEEDNKMSKKIRDGICLGEIDLDLGVIYNKTFIVEEQLTPKQNYLISDVDYRREAIHGSTS